MTPILRRTFRVRALAVLLLACLLASVASAESKVDFSRDVRPILSQHCFRCHGVDDKARKAKLRLDVRDTAIAKEAIVPGKPDDSELVKRVLSDDPDEIMPPPATKQTLIAAQKEILRRWIAEGAEYRPHWAFQPPVMPALPSVKQTDRAKNPIDRFILSGLERENVKPSPQADRYTLVRRAYLDLIGLPPTPQEADEFVHDAAADAYERLVDRLLASPRYGERWARRWLDLARYADTNGYEKDRKRSIWPYRDWVINALNQDMPFDQFTVEQLAGDMLPNATLSQKIATGFHRNTMLNEEGGIDPLEYRFHSMVDRVGTTGTAWLGLTVACAQCHTHKYDPITHHEYYQFMAFLNNADEPELEIDAEEVESKRREVEKKVDRLVAELPMQFPAPDVEWKRPELTIATSTGQSPERQADGSWSFKGEAPDKETYAVTFDVESRAIDRIKLEPLTDGKVGPGRTAHGNFVLSEVMVEVATKEEPEAFQVVKIVKAEADFSQQGFPIDTTIDGDLGNGWAVDGQGRKDRSATFHLETPVEAHRVRVTLHQRYGRSHTIQRFRLSAGSKSQDERPVEVRRGEALEMSYAAWEAKESANAVKWTVLRPDELKGSTPLLTLLPDDSVLASGDTTKSDTYDLSFRDAPAGVTAIRLEALPHESLPKRGPGMIYYEGPHGDFFLSEISVNAGGKASKIERASATFESTPIKTAFDGDQQSGWSVNNGQGRAHTAVFSLEDPTPARGLNIHMLFEKYYAAALGRFRVSVTTDPRGAEVSAIPSEVAAALLAAKSERSAEQRELIFRHYLMVAPELAEARKAIEQARKSVPAAPSTLVMRERPSNHPRPNWLYNRGEFLQPKERVSPGLPSFLPPMNEGEPLNRLAFAKWLVSRENPLTARVTVNRQWQAFFGRGLVKTIEDFGFQGGLPSHPELLDYLAIEFMEQGWSMKKLHRRIVTSETYKQSSRVGDILLARDPENVLLARGPRFRPEAEVLRDSALKAAELLSTKMGGPGVFPPQPPSITTEGAYGPLPWTISIGEDRYRRSIYTFAKRTAPFALFSTFDAPSGEACVARRETSNTPLQALSLMNDQIFVEAAQAMGKLVANLDGTDETRTTKLFRRTLVRPPTPEELASLVSFARRQRDRFKAKELDAEKVSGSKEAAVERATWTAVARAVFNFDETITKN